MVQGSNAPVAENKPEVDKRPKVEGTAIDAKKNKELMESLMKTKEKMLGKIKKKQVEYKKIVAAEQRQEAKMGMKAEADSGAPSVAN